MKKIGSYFLNTAVILISLFMTPGAHSGGIESGGEVEQAEPRTGKATGFYHIEQIDGVWWFIDPEGRPVWIRGIQGVGAADANPIMKRNLRMKNKGRMKEYLKECLDYETEWGFNSVGIHSPTVKILSKYNDMTEKRGGGRIGYFKIIGFSIFGRMGNINYTNRDFWLKDRNGNLVRMVRTTCFPDPFNNEWRNLMEQELATRLPLLRDDRDLIGYFVDNEIGLEGIYRSVYSEAASKAFVKWLGSRYDNNIKNLNKVWGTSYDDFSDIPKYKPDPDRLGGRAKKDFLAFERVIVKEYIDFTISVVKKYDPNHLIISNRFSTGRDTAFDKIKKTADRFLDLFSAYDAIALNIYPVNNKPYFSRRRYEILDYYHRKTGKPIIISEFGVGSYESGIKPCDSWKHRYLSTDKERGETYFNVVTNLVKLPYMIGIQWFNWGNRYGVASMKGGEGASPRNCGVVDNAGDPYKDLTEYMKKTNSIIDTMVRTGDCTIKDLKIPR